MILNNTHDVVATIVIVIIMTTSHPCTLVYVCIEYVKRIVSLLKPAFINARFKHKSKVDVTDTPAVVPTTHTPISGEFPQIYSRSAAWILPPTDSDIPCTSPKRCARGKYAAAHVANTLPDTVHYSEYWLAGATQQTLWCDQRDFAAADIQIL